MTMATLRWRAIVDNDFAGDPDGLVSLAHVLLTDDVGVELVTCTPVDAGLADRAGIDATASARLAAEKARALLGLLDRSEIEVVAGAESFTPEFTVSAAARAIVHAGQVESDVPLAILCGGPLTNVAAALALDPSIQDRATLVWIGGSTSGSAEYNRDTDAAAAAFVRASGMPIIEVPLETYQRLQVSIAEVRHDLATSSPVGAWLADRLLDLPPFVTLHAVLTLGDSALAAVAGLDPSFRRGQSRVVTDIDLRLMWADFLAKMRLRHLPGERP